MRAGRRRTLTGAAVVAPLVLVAVAVTSGTGRWQPHQSAREIADLAGSLPDGLTPLDPANPNPTGDDPLALGTPPEIPLPSSPAALLDRSRRLLDAAPAADRTAPEAGSGRPPPAPQADDDSLLVSAERGTSTAALADSLADAGLQVTPIAGTHVVKVDAGGRDLIRLTTTLAAADGVAAVEPNLVRHASRTPNDPGFAAQAPALGTVHVPAAWDVADTAADVVVAVLDSGVDLDHPDLVGNLVPGFNAVDEGAAPADDNGHGTLVAGIIGAATGNGAGGAGVAWNARIMPVKVLDAAGEGTDDDVAQGIVWATDHGAQVINMSLGGAGTAQVIDDAVAYALAHEVVLVAAAGNEGSLVPSYPAAAPGVLGVTATDAAGRFAWFSNYGPYYFLAAPGIDIPSTALAEGPAPATDTGTGTSFSSPIAAGVAALLRERHPGWGWFEVAVDLIRTARDAGPAGLDDAYAFGLVDAAAALGVAPLGPTSQPGLTGDAANLPGGARAITPGTPASEAIGYEFDQDWFAFDLPGDTGVTLTVTPPPPAPGTRAAEMIPVVELYGPGGGLVAQSAGTALGEPAALTLALGAGHHTVRVLNLVASAGPGSYSLQVDAGVAVPAGGLAPGQQVAAVAAPRGATAVADITGDGRDDVVLATGAQRRASLLVYAQSADGSLRAGQTLPTHATGGSAAVPLAAADLDGDGDVDVASGTAGGLDIAWNADGRLAAPVVVPGAGGAVGAIRAADLDDRGPVELVVQAGGQLQAVRWVGDRLVATPLGVAAAAAYDVADLTGDGRADIATQAPDGMTVHARRADGTWAPAATVALPGVDGSTPGVLVAGDVTGDGRADVVAAGSGRLLLLAQRPSGGLAPARAVGAAGAVDPEALRIGDVTGDGRADLVAVDRATGEVVVHRRTPDGALAAGTRVPGAHAAPSGSADGLALGDLDGDGLADLALAGGDGLAVVRHEAAGAAAPVEGPGPWLAATTPAAHATGVARTVKPRVTFGRDVDPTSVNENTVLLVRGRDGAAVPAAVARSGRTVTLTPAKPLAAGAPYQVVVLGVTTPTGGDVAYEVIPFRVATGPAPTLSVGGTYVPVSLDLDDNGYDDILWYGPGSAADSVWFFGPDGHDSVPTGVSGTFTPVAGDFDGNGYADVFWYAPGSGTDVLWANSRDGITSHVLPVGGVYVPVVADFDRNGYDDIFWYGPGTAADSTWFFGPTGHRTVRQVVNGAGYRPAAGDFTRDGYGDIAWYAPGTAGDSLWRGSAAGFVKAPTLAISSTYRPQVLDFNGDGFDELFLAAATSRFVRSGTGGFTHTQTGPAIPAAGRPIGGDFTGDLRDDLFAYVPGTAADPFYRGTATGVG
jgi:subtilisin family serine protease